MKTGREERTSDLRRRTSVEMGGRRMWRPRGARVVASRGQELEVNGGALARYSYDAFGKLIAKSGRRSSLFRHRFSTKYYDTETGLYYYGYRFYHPGLMRWLNRDPIEEEGGMNLYAMCENKAISCTDSVGHAVFLVLAGLDNNESVFIKQKNVMANSLRTTIRSLVLLNSLTEKQYECLKGNKAIRFNDQPFGGTLGEYKKLIERELKSYVRVSHDYGESLTAIRSMANQMEKSWDYLVYFVHGGNGKRWGVRTIISFSDCSHNILHANVFRESLESRHESAPPTVGQDATGRRAPSHTRDGQGGLGSP